MHEAVARCLASPLLEARRAVGPDGRWRWGGGGGVGGSCRFPCFFLFVFCALWVTCLVDGLVVFFGWWVLVLFAAFCFCLGGFGT